MITKRPWGLFIKVIHFPFLWVKVLIVRGQTSYQSHKNRDEYFIGIFKVPRGEKHRMSRGLYLEIGTGAPDENDIIRHEDNYDRI